ncbi:hypothetical protein EDB81DRAFT_941469 [Dactylonectria macrodidyma]|uniref:FAD-binding domain-containing protein n=1 Tax=Dactylonectria macrodidyma TaxID=307937 RepID=A0A9P9JHB8_9HYPO|nr:hypothetical protein EDB81DRAFT_941469 [Dactylonectria macrodidyma]
MATTNGHHDTAASVPKNPLVHDHPHPLKIAIIGAGIGGLSAAIGLRREGHDITLYEQSRLASEVGAAVHMAPNANGLLRRWGLIPETFGANLMSYYNEFQHSGAVIKKMDLTGPNKQWQHPWQLVHRVGLHDALKKAATDTNGPGKAAVLKTASKVEDVDPAKGTITLADGTTVEADLILGADGIYSRSRKFVTGVESKLFGSGKAAFRFLIPKSVALEDPEIRPLIETDDCLSMWYGDDRRVVIYPCNHNEMLNFVCIHPDSESHATASDEWSKTGSLEQILKVYKDFDPALLKLIQKVAPEELKVWQLLDMENLPTWVNNKLALLGDAAHPFTPHQGQGAGQAMEDAAALSTVLPKGTAPEDVPERLKLYEKIRYERAHRIQDYSRQAGKDWIDGKPQIDMMSYTNYNFGHDEYDYAGNIFKRWLWEQKQDLYWRMPISFGPFPGPRQDHLGRRQPGAAQRTFRTASVKFKTSRTYLETLFPTEQFKFKSASTICEASFSTTTLDKMSWLGGQGYNHFGLYIHGVQYTKKDGSTIDGTFLPVLMESLCDPIVSGREELAMPKLFCDIDIHPRTNSYRMKASWRGATFAEIALQDLTEDAPETEGGIIGGEADYGILAYKYIPAVGEPGKADCQYATVVPHAEESKDVPSTVNKVRRSQNVSIKMDAQDWEALPTLHHVAAGLANIPIYSIVSAKVVEGNGVPNVAACKRIE